LACHFWPRQLKLRSVVEFDWICRLSRDARGRRHPATQNNIKETTSSAYIVADASDNGNKYRIGDLCENYKVIFGDGGGNQRHTGKESHNIENY